MKGTASLGCLLGLLSLGLVSLGCSGGDKDMGTTVVAGHEPAQPSVDDQIKKIQDDPHMPPQAKAMAIGQLKAHGGGVQKK
jgi:hypothetical protein